MAAHSEVIVRLGQRVQLVAELDDTILGMVILARDEHSEVAYA